MIFYSLHNSSFVIYAAEYDCISKRKAPTKYFIGALSLKVYPIAVDLTSSMYRIQAIPQ